VAFGSVAVPLGLYLWNGLGTYFGFGEAKGRVSHWPTIATPCLLIAVAFVEVFLAGR
jgi:hypothetical protein